MLGLRYSVDTAKNKKATAHVIGRTNVVELNLVRKQGRPGTFKEKHQSTFHMNALKVRYCLLLKIFKQTE